jgi:iron complex outermembrane recepter protein
VTLFDNLRLEAGYTYLNTKLIELVGIPAPNNVPWVPGESPWAVVNPTGLPGGPLSLSPKHRLQLSANYTLPLAESIGEITFGATYVYTSRQLANTGTDPRFRYLPASNLLNLNANWRNVLGQPFDIALFMTNVTNEKYPLNVANFYNSFGFESVNPNEPRMWGARLRYRFGS